MTDVHDITRRGFSLKGKNDLDLAFLSLRLALKSFFSTYSTIRNRFSPDDLELDKTAEECITFCEACVETIVHFQHFFELIFKDILRRDHPLLASRIYSHPTILHNVLHNRALTTEDELKVQSIEFTDALTSLCDLIKAKQLPDFQNLLFIKHHKSTFEELNRLRNRVWHRGSFLLSYTSLDAFVGRFILPILDSTNHLSPYEKPSLSWKYKHTECGIDPIESIRSEYLHHDEPNPGKIALFKEIGRAAYINPLYDKKLLEQSVADRIARIEKEMREFEARGEKVPETLLISRSMAGLPYRMASEADSPYINKSKNVCKTEAEENLFEIAKCPVCGVDSLILYDESDWFEDSDTGKSEGYNWVRSAKCECCTFEIDSRLKLKEYALPIRDFWQITRL